MSTKLLCLALLVGLVSSNTIDKFFIDEAHIVNGDDSSHGEYVQHHDKENIFDILQKYVFKGFFKDLYKHYMWNDMFDKKTRSGFNEDTDQFLKMIQPDFCFNSTANSTTDCKDSPILGCTCRAAFAQLQNKCSQMPCTLWREVYKSGADLMKAIRKSTSVTDLLEAGIDNLERLSKKFGKCSDDVLDTVRTCIVKYDGKLVKDYDREDYHQFMAEIDSEGLTEIAKNASGAYFRRLRNKETKERKECNLEFDGMLVGFTRMFDNSLLNEGEECDQFRHMSHVFYNVAEKLSKYDWEKADMEEAVDFIVKTFIAVPKGFWCGRQACTSTLKERFLGVCSKKMIKKLANINVVNRIIGVMESFVEAIGEEFPNISEKSRALLVKYGNPVKLCPKQYRGGKNATFFE